MYICIYIYIYINIISICISIYLFVNFASILRGCSSFWCRSRCSQRIRLTSCINWRTSPDIIQSCLFRCKAKQDCLLISHASVCVCVRVRLAETLGVWNVKTLTLCIKLVNRCKALQNHLCDTRMCDRRLECVCVCVSVCRVFLSYILSLMDSQLVSIDGYLRAVYSILSFSL